MKCSDQAPLITGLLPAVRETSLSHPRVDDLLADLGVLIQKWVDEDADGTGRSLR